MDNRAEVREFLISLRAKITAQQAGIPDVGARRVPGLRRGEVAALAGVSVEYHAKLERGAIGGVSASVLDAIARALHDLVGELPTRSDDFRRRWSTHNVRYHGAGTKTFHHHEVGDLTLAYESVDMISEPGLTLTFYAAEPASPTAHALDLLASWTAATADSTAPETEAHR